MSATSAVPVLTSSERRAYKRCPQRWWWAYRQGLVAYDTDIKLWFGIGIHLALAHYYGRNGFKRNMDFIEVWEAFCDEDDMSKAIRTRPFDDAESEWVDARALGIAMLQGYHEHWGGDPDWDVIAVEEPFAILIPHPADPDADIAEFNSTFDGVYRDRHSRRVKLMEHKTAAAVQLGWLLMDDQGGSYWAMAQMILRERGILKSKESIEGIEYNFLRKALPDDRPKDADGYACNNPQKAHYLEAFGKKGIEVNPKATLAEMQEVAAHHKMRVLGERSKVQPAPLFIRETAIRTRREQSTQVKRIQAEVMAMNRHREEGPDSLYKNPTRDCEWDCPFFNMCQLHDAGSADWQEFRDSVFMQRDPYERYRKSASL